ncbi:transcription initiation factor TFIIH subunit 1, partial [Lecanoromycetidae sp. Uapishka_2]
MAPPRGSAAYKKKDGTLALSKDGQSVSWTPVTPPGSKPALTLPVSGITNLQQTPASSAKVMLKIFAQASSIDAAETHVFSFTSPRTARAEADAIKDALSKAIQSMKSGGVPLAAPGGGAASSAAMAIASAVSSNPRVDGSTESFLDDGSLKQDVELQQSLMESNFSLKKTFVESLRIKPESISTAKFTAQFWSTRIHLLRAHAIEKNQTRGAYNVLASIKVDPSVNLKISSEQIKLIFKQHSLVRRAYDENVPNIPEEVYFARFFQSRLFKKLKGERITDADPTDNLLDKYLQYDEDPERAKRLLSSHVPHIIDVEGNEENHSQRKGNKADFTMRPTSVDRVPIIRTLNSLSEKILSHVAPNDIDPSLPIGIDEETFNSLALRDLQGDSEENRVILNIKDQSLFFNSDKQSDISADALEYAKQDPVKVLRSIRADLALVSSNTNLDTAIGVDDNSDSSDDESAPKKPHVGSKASLSAATAQIHSAIGEQRAQSDDLSSTGFSTVQTSSTSGLSPAIFDRLSLTHATTTEFLQHFWSAFLSGDPARADEIGKLLETLDRAMERIKAVATDAEADRQKEVDKHKRKVQAEFERTGRQRKFNYDSVAGGAKAVNQLLAPTVKAIEVATKQYGKALKEQGGDVA